MCKECTVEKSIDQAYITKFKVEKGGEDHARARTCVDRNEIDRTAAHFHCLACHRLNGRMHSRPEFKDFKALWDKFDKETKQQFRKENAGTKGKALAKRMQETIAEHKIRQQMTDKYKQTQEQLASVWENASEINVTLLQHVLNFIDKLVHEQVKRRKMSQEAAVAPQKRAKVTARPKDVVPSADVSHAPVYLPYTYKLHRQQILPLQKLSQKLKVVIQKLIDSCTRIEEKAIEEIVPLYLINKGDEHLTLIQAERSAIDFALQHLRVQNYYSMAQSAKDKLAAATKVARSLENMIEEAIVHKAEDE